MGDNVMKTGKTTLLALFALIMSAALIVFGCEEEPAVSDITFTVSANTQSGKDTASLEIAFSGEVAGLTMSNITLTNSDKIIKNGLTGGGKNWSLAIKMAVEGLAGTIPCSVTITKDGVSSGSQTVGGGGVVNASGKADFSVDHTPVNADNEATLTIEFTKDVSLNSALEITITPATAATRGTLTPVNGRKYTLPITGITPGTISIGINNTNVTDAKKDVDLTKTTPPYTGGIEKIELQDKNPKYSNLVGTFIVEIGTPKKLTASISPKSLENTPLSWFSLDTSVATVDQNGLVTAISSSPKNTVTIVARSPDEAVGGAKEITVVNRKIPQILGVDTNTTAYYKTATKVSNQTSNSSISLDYGDLDLKFTTVLEESVGKRTNDQVVIVEPMNSPYFTIKKIGPEEKANEVSGIVYSLVPGKVTTVDFPSGIPVRIAADYNYNTAWVEFTVKVESVSVTTITNEFTTTVSGETKITDIDFKNAVESSKTVMYVTITPDHPYNSITLKQNPVTHPGTTTYVTSSLVSGTKNVFKLTRAAETVWGVGTGTIKLDVTVTNADNTTKVFENNIELKYTAGP
jgi:hypothetical protein